MIADLDDLRWQLQAHILKIEVGSDESTVIAIYHLPDRDISQKIITDDISLDGIFDQLLEFRKAVADWRKRKLSA